jgi:hypothetical protein
VKESLSVGMRLLLPYTEVILAERGLFVLCLRCNWVDSMNMRVLQFQLRVSALAMAANECPGSTVWTEIECGDADDICMLPLLFTIVILNVHRVPVACQLCYSSKREEELPQLWANEFHEFLSCQL